MITTRSLVRDLTDIKESIGARIDSMDAVQKSCAINDAWWKLDALINQIKQECGMIEPQREITLARDYSIPSIVT